MTPPWHSPVCFAAVLPTTTAVWRAIEAAGEFARHDLEMELRQRRVEEEEEERAIGGSGEKWAAGCLFVFIRQAFSTPSAQGTYVLATNLPPPRPTRDRETWDGKRGWVEELYATYPSVKGMLLDHGWMDL